MTTTRISHRETGGILLDLIGGTRPAVSRAVTRPLLVAAIDPATDQLSASIRGRR